MSVTTASLDGFDLLSDDVRVSKYDFPEAKPNDDARALMRAGMTPSASDYFDPPFTITLIVKGASADAVKAAVADLDRRFKSGARLTWAEGGSPSLDTYLKEVELSGESYRSTWARVTFSGTRTPAWCAPWSTLTPLTAPCFGTVDVADTIGGDLEADVALSITSPQATTFIGYGVKHDPAADYDAIDDYSGTSDATCVGGARTANATLTASYAALGTAPSLGMEANRGEHLVCARVTTSDADTTLKASSSVTSSGSLGQTVSADEPAITVPAAALRAALLGRVKVPTAEMPGVAAQASFGATQTAAHGTGSSTVFISNDIPIKRYAQTFAIAAASRIDSAAVYCASASTSILNVELWTTSAGVPSAMIATSNALATTTPELATATFATDLAAGTYAVVVRNTSVATVDIYYDGSAGYTGGSAYYFNGSTWAAGVLGDATADLRFSVAYRPVIAMGATTPVKAANTKSSKTASLDAVARIPLNDYAAIVTQAFTAGQGFKHDSAAGDIYLTNSDGDIGSTLMATASVYGKRIGFAPGVTNRFVVVADTPNNAAPSDLTISGQYREKYLRLARS